MSATYTKKDISFKIPKTTRNGRKRTSPVTIFGAGLRGTMMAKFRDDAMAEATAASDALAAAEGRGRKKRKASAATGSGGEDVPKPKAQKAAEEKENKVPPSPSPLPPAEEEEDDRHTNGSGGLMSTKEADAEGGFAALFVKALDEAKRSFAANEKLSKKLHETKLLTQQLARAVVM
jgi:hypothetical protein